MTGIKTLAERTRLPVAEIVRRLCEFAFARTKLSGDISFLLEPTRTVIQEDTEAYKAAARPKQKH